MVKRRASLSAHTWASASRKLGLAASASASAGAAGDWAVSTPHTASSDRHSASAHTPPHTCSSRAGVYGSSSWPLTPAVTAKPTIIISHTAVAAAARRSAATRLASSTSSEVPAAPTPRPISTKAATASAMPAAGLLPIHTVASAASTPPAASTAMPPTIHGVRRAVTSLPWPRRGRSICTR